MKYNCSQKILLTSCLLVILQTSNAQNNWIKDTGKVGIGTTTPISQMEIVSPGVSGSESLLKLRVSDASSDFLEILNATNSNMIFMPTIKGHTTTNAGSLFVVGVTEPLNDIGTAPISTFDSRTSVGKVNVRPLFTWASYGTRYMTMAASGNLGLGIDNPSEKLSVNGTIRAREIKVDILNWPDYVFKKEYNLPSLLEVEKHIEKNGHLPDILPASELQASGLNLGEMNKLLLRKIEELTLYLIDQNKNLIDQNKKIVALEKRLSMNSSY